MRARIYVAGPITLGDTEHNITRAEVAGLALMKAGFAPHVPHLWYRAHNVGEANHDSLEAWLAVDLPWVFMSDAVVRLPGASAGADRETALAEEYGIPVYRGDTDEAAVQAAIDANPKGMEDRWFHIWREIGALYNRKQQDYGRKADPYANVRGSAEWGVRPWVGAMIRATDKVKRLQKAATDGNLANESAADSFKDLAVYALIALVLHEQEHATEPAREPEPELSWPASGVLPSIPFPGVYGIDALEFKFNPGVITEAEIDPITYTQGENGGAPSHTSHENGETPSATEMLRELREN